MRDHDDEVKALGLVILGVSVDSVRSNKKFADKNDFPFLLLSDSDRKTCIAYGAATSADAAFALRISYIIGPDGTIEHVYEKVSPKTHLDVILKDLA